MAKTLAPFLGLGSTGTIGDLLTASTWKGIRVMKLKPTPTNPKTVGQVGMRTNFAAAADVAKTNEVAIKAAWLAAVMGLALTWFNGVISQAQANLMAAMGVQLLPTRVNNTPPAVPTALTASISGNLVTLTWTDPADADLLLVYIYRDPVTGFVPSRANLVGYALAGVKKWTDRPGTGTWYYKAAADDKDGNVGTATASEEAIVP